MSNNASGIQNIEHWLDSLLTAAEVEKFKEQQDQYGRVERIEVPLDVRAYRMLMELGALRREVQVLKAERGRIQSDKVEEYVSGQRHLIG